jgi:hypothetical protein
MSADTQLVPADAGDILTQVLDQIRRESLFPRAGGAVRFYSGRAPRSAQRGGRFPGPECGGAAARWLEALHDRLRDDLQPTVPAIGAAPPGLPTLRGICGSIVIRLLRALLWWHSESVQVFSNSVVDQFYEELGFLEILVCEQAEIRAEVAALREEVRRTNDILSRVPGSCR